MENNVDQEKPMDHYTEERKQSFFRGESSEAYMFMGAHLLPDGEGVVFRVWAPNAKSVHVAGDFNYWNREEIPMQKDFQGVWEARWKWAKNGDRYKYWVERPDGSFVFKSDPYAFRQEPLPGTASMVWDVEGFKWSDKSWYKKKKGQNPLESPISIYEVHLGSWRRHWDNTYYSYKEIADELIPYVKEMGYTHVEFMPLTEYPFDGSWGYQVTGYFAPTHRFGEPEGLKHLINGFHKAGIGVILDWVPAHFPKDENGLFEFDGTCCYELSDPAMNEHTDWHTRIFDYGRWEVKSFLKSSALYWIREFHVDGIRVDAVASMLYLDYGRQYFKPNIYGGNYNLEAIEFFKELNTEAFGADPDVLMVAEESTAFPMVTKPGYDGGLGFNFKWNMGWMNDTLRYMSNDPLFRKEIHGQLTHTLSYAFSENYILPLSHDEVVHLKKSLIEKMPGYYHDKFANLRTLYGYMVAHPGKMLTFMGSEIAQFTEWSEKKSLDWFLLDYEMHRGMQLYVKELNKFYRENPEFWDNEERGWESFEWICENDWQNSVISLRRKSKSGSEIICIFNFTPVKRECYRIGLPEKGTYRPVFSSDDRMFGGNSVYLGDVVTTDEGMHGHPQSGLFNIPPLSATFYKLVR